MNFLTALQADRLIAQIREESDPTSPSAKKAFAKLAKLGNGAIPKILEALASADKRQTAEYVELLNSLINDKTLTLVVQGLAERKGELISMTPDGQRPVTLMQAAKARGKRIGLVTTARDEERLQFGETVYLLEPNIKRSSGGLREIQLLRWIGFLKHGTPDPDGLVQCGGTLAGVLRLVRHGEGR